MINVIIYLKKEFDPKEIAEALLKERLIASASIDVDNISMKMKNKVVSEEPFNVITAQSKSLLFNAIVDFVERKVGEEVAINATPIVGTSKLFDETVRSKTNPI